MIQEESLKEEEGPCQQLGHGISMFGGLGWRYLAGGARSWWTPPGLHQAPPVPKAGSCQRANPCELSPSVPREGVQGLL